MKTPIQTAQEQIEKLAFEPMLGSSIKVVDIEDVRKVLQSLLPSEREAFIETYNNGALCDMNVRFNKDDTITEVHLSAQDYFDKIYNTE
jgi:hypothetical protein